ncbi:hypothetical protein [Microbulbifer hydrolyticus]|uniref:Uncharacterized protein n=1 Tax=Microbulbifer hydrolyticus TaxID=48074 RepID=A0A6P1TAS6_9GAMM|nr:hypothetical protein [Microbulbifer hydrolyticus]MBB5211503.1 hypothetical protein [Microbulbifer hydrolyticus]QHQ37752.1 hypothetical protein GTQ55_01285 [Microbulbifer hydrolyticus]
MTIHKRLIEKCLDLTDTDFTLAPQFMKVDEALLANKCKSDQFDKPIRLLAYDDEEWGKYVRVLGKAWRMSAMKAH